jgi:hypothetical protein
VLCAVLCLLAAAAGGLSAALRAVPVSNSCFAFGIGFRGDGLGSRTSAPISIPCCIFVTHALAYVYAAVAAAFSLWSASLVLRVRAFTAADALGQWYFSAVMPGGSVGGCFQSLEQNQGTEHACSSSSSYIFK